MTRRVESLSEGMDQVLGLVTEYFSLRFNESLEVMDTALLVVSVRMDFQDSTTTEDFLTLLHIKERMRGEDIYNEFKTYVCENDISIHKLVAITTDGALAMHCVRAGFIALCCNVPDFPNCELSLCDSSAGLSWKVVDL